MVLKTKKEISDISNMTHMCPHCGHVFSISAPLLVRKKTYSEVSYILGDASWDWDNQEVKEEIIISIICSACQEDVTEYFKEDFIGNIIV